MTFYILERDNRRRIATESMNINRIIEEGYDTIGRPLYSIIIPCLFYNPPQETFLLIKYLSLHTDTDRNCFLIIKQLIMYSVCSVLK